MADQPTMNVSAANSVSDEDLARIFDGPEVVLLQMLDAREQRANAIAAAAREAGESGCVVSITLAIPGPVKTSEPLRKLFDYYYTEVTDALSGYDVQTSRLTTDASTGPEVQFVVDVDAKTAKQLLVPIEEKGRVGRLADLDVLSGGESPEGVSRTELGLPQRKCLVCDKPSKECGRARAHTVPEMQHAVAAIMVEAGY